jgi:tetratricopeptide (TPR) repeat protein
MTNSFGEYILSNFLGIKEFNSLEHKSRLKRRHYRAMYNWMTKYDGSMDNSYFHQLKPLLEAVHHLCEIGDWEKIEGIFFPFVNLNILLEQGFTKEVFNICKELLEKSPPIRLEIMCKEHIGIALTTMGELVLASKYLNELLQKTRLHADELTEIFALIYQGYALQHLGVIALEQCRYTEAISLFEKALKASAEESKFFANRVMESNALGNLGEAYYAIKDYNKALSFFEQSLAIDEKYNKKGEASNLGSIGNVYYALGNYEEAASFLKRQLNLSREIHFRSGEGKALLNLGNVYKAKNFFSCARSCYEARLAIAKEISDKFGEARALVALGGLYLDIGNNLKALDYSSKGIILAKALENTDIQQSGINISFNAYVRHEKFKEEQSSRVNVSPNTLKSNYISAIGKLRQVLNEFDVEVEYHEKATELILDSIKSKIDTLMAEDIPLQYLLEWIYHKSNSIHTSYEASAVRACYLDIVKSLELTYDKQPFGALDEACHFDRDLESCLEFDLFLDTILARSIPLDRGLVPGNLSFDLATLIDPSIKSAVEAARDRDMANDRNILMSKEYHLLGHNHALYREPVRYLKLAIKLIQAQSILDSDSISLSNTSDFEESLNKLLKQLPDTSYLARKNFKVWCNTEGEEWMKSMRALLVMHRNIAHAWNLTEQQKKKLESFCTLNELFFDCLNIAKMLNDVDAEYIQKIRESFLLPTSTG